MCHRKWILVKITLRPKTDLQSIAQPNFLSSGTEKLIKYLKAESVITIVVMRLRN